MIFDRVENAKNYLGISPELDRALELLDDFTARLRPSGRIEQDGERLYANCAQYRTSLDDSRLYEVHQKYIDIHVAVAGEELVQVVEAADAQLEKAYDESVEAALYRAEGSRSAVHVRAGFFAVLFPGEIHRAGGAPGTETEISKFIVKVLCRP